MTGTVHARSTVIPRCSPSKRRHQGVGFQVARHPSSGLPVIWCPETGRVWTVTWEELIDLAIGAGITLSSDASEEDLAS